MPLPTLERFMYLARSFPETRLSRRTFWLKKTATPWIRDAAIPHQVDIEHPDTVCIYIPSTQKDGSPIDPILREKTVRDVLQTFSSQFGGATATEQWGQFEHASGPRAGDTIHEPVTAVWSRVPKEFMGKEPILDMLGSYANHLRETLNQEMVMFEIPGHTYFV